MHKCSETGDCLKSKSKCKSGCFCSDGLIFDDSRGKCVSPGECLCHSQFSGNILSPGQSEIVDCNRCRCASGRMVCTNYDCSEFQAIFQKIQISKKLFTAPIFLLLFFYFESEIIRSAVIGVPGQLGLRAQCHVETRGMTNYHLKLTMNKVSGVTIFLVDRG